MHLFDAFLTFQQRVLSGGARNILFVQGDIAGVFEAAKLHRFSCQMSELCHG